MGESASMLYNALWVGATVTLAHARRGLTTTARIIYAMRSRACAFVFRSEFTMETYLSLAARCKFIPAASKECHKLFAREW